MTMLWQILCMIVFVLALLGPTFMALKFGAWFESRSFYVQLLQTSMTLKEQPLSIPNGKGRSVRVQDFCKFHENTYKVVVGYYLPDRVWETRTQVESRLQNTAWLSVIPLFVIMYQAAGVVAVNASAFSIEMVFQPPVLLTVPIAYVFSLLIAGITIRTIRHDVESCLRKLQA